MVVVVVRLHYGVQQTLLTPLTIVLLIINSPTGRASGNYYDYFINHSVKPSIGLSTKFH